MNFDILFDKLERCGKQKEKSHVRINDTLSTSLRVKSGVPQGTLLGSLLFLVYVNELMEVIKDCKIFRFADDNVLVVDGDTC